MDKIELQKLLLLYILKFDSVFYVIKQNYKDLNYSELKMYRGKNRRKKCNVLIKFKIYINRCNV